MINIINLNEKLYCGEYIFRAENYESNGFLKYIIDKTNKNNKLIAEFIKGYIYKNENDVKQYIKVITTEKGIMLEIEVEEAGLNWNKWINGFILNLDLYIHYYDATLTNLSKHFKIIKDIIREEHQWHWLGEEPNYNNLIMNIGITKK